MYVYICIVRQQVPTVLVWCFVSTTNPCCPQHPIHMKSLVCFGSMICICIEMPVGCSGRGVSLFISYNGWKPLYSIEMHWGVADRFCVKSFGNLTFRIQDKTFRPCGNVGKTFENSSLVPVPIIQLGGFYDSAARHMQSHALPKDTSVVGSSVFSRTFFFFLEIPCGKAPTKALPMGCCTVLAL